LDGRSARKIRRGLLPSAIATTGVQGNYAYPPKFVRLLVNSQPDPASVSLTVMQNYQK
jgi:hypothetical protein